MPQVEVTFDIDANGIVHVGAKDLGTGKEQTIKITASSGLSEQEIQRMVKEAEAHKADDEKRKAIINARNTLDGLIYSVEKTVKEHGDKVDATTKDAVTKAVEDAKKVLDSKDEAELKRATEELTTASNKMAEVMYKSASASGTGAGPSGNGGQGETKTEGASAEQQGQSKKDDDVIDADFKEV
jgi:molecular chaperone DnaK